jgi:hypothetical protein
MKTILEPFKAILIVGVCALMVVAADAPTQIKIKELEKKNAELRSDVKEMEDEIRWAKRLGRRPNSNTAIVLRYDRAELESNEREIAALKAGTNAPPVVIPPATATNGSSFYAPRYIVETNTSPARPIARTNTPARILTNAAPVDWRTAEQREKWEAVRKQFSAWPNPDEIQVKPR